MRSLLLVASGLIAFTVTTPALLKPAQAPSPAAAAKATHPLTAPWTGPYGGVPPWDQAKAEVFPAALQAALDEQRAEVNAISRNRAVPTFENTIEAIERAGQTYDRVARMFSVMRDNMSNEQFQALDREWQPKMAAADDEIVFNAELFQKVRAVSQALPKSKLTPEQKRLVTRTYEALVRQRAQLNAAQKKRLSEINQELAAAFSDFATKVLADENTWTVLEGEKDLAGLPASLVSAAKAAAEERDLPGKWLIVNTRSSVDPFITFSTRRDLREKVWKKFKARGDNGDANDTKGTIANIVKLRAERAQLLGFASHAHWRMADTMALDPAKAQALMLQVWPAAVARVKEEVADMQKEIALRHRLPQFLHLFSSDAYSAGYYSYLWSDVMAADTWQAFIEKGGPWDKEVANRLRTHILSDGNTIDRAEAYRRFRGRNPDVKALLEKRGFPTKR